MLIVSSPRFADHVTPPGHPESPERADVLEAIAAARQGPRRRGVEPRAATRDAVASRAYRGPRRRHRGHARAGADDRRRHLHLARHRRRRAAGGGRRRAGRGCGARAGDRPTARLRRWCGRRGTTPSRRARWASASTTTSPWPRRTPGPAGLSRVAVVDYDVHHGNGTQEMFYADPSVLYISTHQFPFYPGTGAATETGSGRGKGFTVNVPHRGRRDRRRLRARLRARRVCPCWKSSAGPAARLGRLRRPRAGSAGADADDQSGLRVDDRAAWRDCRPRSDGRLVLVTEGGYALPALGESLDRRAGRARRRRRFARSGDDAGGQPVAAIARLQPCACAQAGRWHGL